MQTVYEIKTNYLYEDCYKDKQLFDFNDYPQDSKFFYLANETVIGKMKDEFKGKIIIQFAGSKSKMYSLIDVDGEEVKKAKVASKKFVKSTRQRIC